MDWIFDNFQIVALVGIALASWIKSRMDAKAAEREERQAREEMGEGEEIFGPEEAWEEPPPRQPAPPPLHRAVPPPVPTAAQYEAELEAAALLKHQMDLQERLRQIRETKASTSGGAAVTRARVAASQSHAAAAAPVKSGLRSALRNRSEIRRAVVLREILGPPLGLR
jgi:hypothetical protein